MILSAENYDWRLSKLKGIEIEATVMLYSEQPYSKLY